MSQSKIHFLPFLVFDLQHDGFWAVVSVANFRGAGDNENMALSSISGAQGRNKAKDLFTHLEGLISILTMPTKENLESALPKISVSATQGTQDLLAGLQAATQTQTPKASRATSPASGGSKDTRPQVAGKSPRYPAPTSQTPANPQPVIDLSDSSSDEGDTTSDEEDIQSGQPEPSRLPVPSKPVKPRATFAQTTLTGGLVANKRAKLTHVSTEDDDEATVIKFSGGNLTKAQLNELVERRFLEQTMEEESGEGSPKKAKKNKKEKGKPKPMFTKAGKPSSAASTEQKGTPLFMNRRLIFSCSCLW